MNPPLHPLDALDEALPLPLARATVPGPHAPLVTALVAEVAQPPAALWERVATRVAVHRNSQAGLQTVRQPMRRVEPQPWARGVLARHLQGNSWLVEVASGAALPPSDAPLEILVLRGALACGDLTVCTAEYALLPPGASVTAACASLLYWREHRSGPFSAPDQPVRVQPAAWEPLREGVVICPLHAEGGAVSLLARLQAGARIPAHPHGLDEECLMVEGDLFLGDVLLREGEYQAARRGSQHGDLVADGPCLLFFHGAIDAAAVDNAHRAAQGWPALGG